MAGQSDEPVLVVQVEARLYALPLQHVREILRPMAMQPVNHGPPFVTGLATIRGVASPVVDLPRLLGLEREELATGRWVRLRVGLRDVLLAVDAALGVRRIDAAHSHALPPLLREAARGGVDQLTMLDEQLLRVFSGGLHVPDDVFAVLPRA